MSPSLFLSIPELLGLAIGTPVFQPMNSLVSGEAVEANSYKYHYSLL
jgi:hypothetical protein